MSYDVYLGTTLLPVTPEKITVKINNNNSTIVLINDGEINVLKKAGLSDISLTALLPNVKYPFAVYKSGFQKADIFLEKIESLKTSQKPFQFIVSRRFPKGGKLYDTNITVSLEDYKIIEDAGNGFDVSVDINLKQYKAYQTKTVEIKTPAPTTNTTTTTQPTATTTTTRPTTSAPTYKTYTHGNHYPHK